MTVTRQGDLSLITEQLLSWYARHQRDLPWRQTRDPYCIWVSEIMLQQTQVETVIPYYYRFLSRFPTVQLLAAASLDEVLKVWENMGYYARARNLHKAAREVNDRCGGEIPRAWNELVDLPGVGSYTAAAILSMAFGQKAPALDANGRRVLSRVFAIDQPLDRSRTQHQLAELARKLLPDRDPGSFNQALMDLGSDICTPRKPLCVSCPIQNLCQAYQQGLQNMLPVARKRSAIPHSHVTAGVIRDHRGRLLIVRRPDKGLLGGLWKFPGGTQDSNQLLQRCLSKKIRDEVGIQVRVGQLITSVDHAFTHLRITLHAFQCTRRGGREQALGCVGWCWTTPQELCDFAFSRADRKIIEVLDFKGQQVEA